MTSKRIIFLIIAAFIAGNFVLVYLYYNSQEDIQNLIDNNQKVLRQFQVSSELKTFENNVVLVESKIRGMVTTGDTTYIKGLNEEIANIQSYIDTLEKISTNDSTKIYVDILKRLVHEKLELGKQIVQAFTQKGKAGAEQIIRTQQGKTLTDSILLMSDNIRRARRTLLIQSTNIIDNSIAKVQRLDSILIIFTIIIGAALCWYIINTIRTQNRLIQQIRVSEKKLQEAVRVKENFLANMSHEIRTPLNAVVGFTRLLQRKKLDEESKLYVHTIQQSGENLISIVNDILDLSKIEAGIIRIEAVPFSLRELVHSVETMFRTKTEKKGLELYTNVDESLPDTLEGDATRLTQILVNLIGNAIKFTSKGNISIRAINQGMKGDTITVGIEISDTGIGIENEKLEDIFGRFQQANDKITREFGGTGLGLSIVKELVELQNGSIGVKSQPGKGTTFHLTIPYKISHRAVSAKINIDEPVSLQNVKILVVEDNEVNLSLIQHLFRNWQIKFDTALNGKEALETLKSSTYDLILMDIQMPQMDGYTTTQEIRNYLKLNTPIIAMTAHAMAGEREKCLSYGMDEYISKPIREEQLKKLIVQFVPLKTNFSSKKEKTDATPLSDYQYIDLNYMKDVSAGNKDYEKEVTKQFIDAVQQALNALEEAEKAKNTQHLKRIAHELKTTVSVMGLTEKLQLHLDSIEDGVVEEKKLQENIDYIKRICLNALPEAKHYLASITE